jgi:hypothetical protein
MLITMWAKFAEKNRAIARIVVADQERYGGQDAALVRWARAVIDAGDQNDLYPTRKGQTK